MYLNIINMQIYVNCSSRVINLFIIMQYVHYIITMHVLAMPRTCFLVQFITFLLRQSPPTFRYFLRDLTKASRRLFGSLAWILLGVVHDVSGLALRFVIVPGSGRQARDAAADARQLGLRHVVGGHRAQQPVDRPALLRAYLAIQLKRFLCFRFCFRHDVFYII